MIENFTSKRSGDVVNRNDRVNGFGHGDLDLYRDLGHGHYINRKDAKEEHK